jgi:murein DD-endopeptidase MepM/ murein hydrolase activator NlpD
MKADAKSTASQLEAFVIKQLLTSSGAFKGGTAAGSSLTAQMFADALSEAVAGAGGLGLAPLLTPGPTAGATPPSASRITSPFGSRRDPITGSLSVHHGVDLAAASGTPIPAAKDGVVIAAGERGGYGNAVEIAHPDGTSTLYAHAQEVAVTPGQPVRAGEIVAWVGQTGRTTGPHLHLEVRKAGHFVDPVQALKAYRLRDEEGRGGPP